MISDAKEEACSITGLNLKVKFASTMRDTVISQMDVLMFLWT
jgi:hypothetical protein